MPVPYVFASLPNGTAIPLSYLDANFAYLTSSPVFSGNVSIGGTLAVAGATNISSLTASGNGSFGGTLSANLLQVSGNATNPAALVNTRAHFIGANATQTRLMMDSFGAGNNITFRASGGTSAAPSGVTSGTAIFSLNAFGYGATAYSSVTRATLGSSAAETWTDAAQGTYLTFSTTQIGTTTTAERLRIDDAGNVGIGTSSPNGAAGYRWLTINGSSSGGIMSLSAANTETFRIQSINASYTVLNNVTAIPMLFYTGNAERMRIGTNGQVGINDVENSAVQLNIGGTITSSGGTSYAVNTSATIPATSTSLGSGFATSISTAAASFTCSTLTHFAANQGTFGAGSSVTSQYGYYVAPNLIGAAFNFGLYSAIPSGTGRWNIYAAGTAANWFSGDVLVFGAGGLGYTTGSGGTVTQATSRTTGVTLNKTNGAITLFSAAGTAAYQTFTVTNSTVAASDVIHVCQKSGTDKYIVLVTNVAAGSFQITFATTGGTTTEQPVFSFAVIKAVTA